MANSEQRPALVLFDIDGTLVLTGRAGQRAMTHAFQDVYGVPGAFTSVAMAGRTDTSLVSDALRHYGIPDTAEAHARFRTVYVEKLSKEIHHPGTGRKGVMPGARELLLGLASHPHLHIALLTGNYRDAAVIKLWFFDCGTTSGGAPSATTPAIAMRSSRLHASARSRSASQTQPASGDRDWRHPDDVKCARCGRRLLDCGRDRWVQRRYPARAGADIVLNDLSDTERVVQAARYRSRRGEANGARWPSRSSKSVAAPSSGQAGFDSQALPPARSRALELKIQHAELTVGVGSFQLKVSTATLN